MSAPSVRQWAVPENFVPRAGRTGNATRERRAGPGGRAGSGVRGAQHPQVPAARDLHRVRRTRSPVARLPLLGPGRLTDGVGERFEIVAARTGGGRGVGEPDDLPAARGGEPLAVFGAEVVAVGLGVGGERAEDRGRVGIDVRQCRDGGTAARGSRTATYRAHDVGRYRTLERAATTLPQLTPRVARRNGPRAEPAEPVRPARQQSPAPAPTPRRGHQGEHKRSSGSGPTIGARTGSAPDPGRNAHPVTSSGPVGNR